MRNPNQPFAQAKPHTDDEQDGHTFVPDTVYANVSDVIRFHFFPNEHSVARAEYLMPCQPIDYTTPGKVGFWSGFEPVTTPRADVNYHT